MITRTFRLPPEYDKILSEEAESHGLTISALLNQIIRQYIMITRFTEKNPTLSMSYRTFEPLIEVIPDEKLAEVAEKTGSILPIEGMLRYGKQLDFDSVNWYIDTIYGRYKNWFNSKQSIVNGKERVHLTHQLNHKWSLYLGAYMKGMFNTILDRQPLIETRPNTVTLYLTPPKKNLKIKRVLNRK
jgi:hypothetical protein